MKLGETSDGQKCAIKIFNPNMSDKLKQALIDELDMLHKLKHNNIVSMIDNVHDADWVKSDGSTQKRNFIALELVSGGELFDFISQGGGFNEKISRFYFMQMLAALHYMHSQGVSHRDLKPENILIDDMYNIKIADFGFAAPLAGRDGQGLLKTKLGTESYMSPELHERKHYSGSQADIFAIGIILFIMHTGHPPFAKAMPTDQHYKWFHKNQSSSFWKMHGRYQKGGFSEEFIDLITQMMQYQPAQRLELADLLGHEWLKGEIATTEEVQEEFRNRHDALLQEKAKEQQKKELLRQKRMAMQK